MLPGSKSTRPRPEARKPSVLLCSAFAAGVAAFSAGGATTNYPAKPMRIVCPVPPGGGLDLVTRLFADKLAARSGQPTVVDNRPGASGSIGVSIVAKAPPDGYTVLFASSSTVATNPALQRLSPEAALKDFAPVSLVSSVPWILVAHPSVAAHSVRELIRLAAANPKLLNYSSSGAGSGAHLAMELFKNMSAVDLVHIPYKGSGPAAIALISGQVHVGFNNVVPALPHIRSGKLRALGVSGSARSSVVPDTPTIAEAGVAGFEALQWYGLLLPALTPDMIVSRLHHEIVAILKEQDVRERLAQEGGEVIGSTPAVFKTHIHREISKWTKVVQMANISAY